MQVRASRRLLNSPLLDYLGIQGSSVAATVAAEVVAAEVVAAEAAAVRVVARPAHQHPCTQRRRWLPWRNLSRRLTRVSSVNIVAGSSTRSRSRGTSQSAPRKPRKLR